MAASIDSSLLPVAAALSDDARRVLGCTLVGVYLHGSSVLGDFLPATSDLDVLVVAENVPASGLEDLNQRLAAAAVGPAVGIEASVVDLAATRKPLSPWPFLSHVTTHPANRKIVLGGDMPGDPDLALHYLVARRFGWTPSGPPPREVFGDIPREIVLAHMAAELRWASREAPAPYAVLNACRALRYAFDGTVCSKTAGAEWALSAKRNPELVAGALAARRTGSAWNPGQEAAEWVQEIATVIIPP